MAILSNGEIRDLTKNLTTAVAENRHGDARKIMEKLQSGVKPTEEVIRATKVGQAVAKLRNSEDKGISQLAKDLVRTWKSKVDSQREAKKKDCEHLQQAVRSVQSCFGLAVMLLGMRDGCDCLTLTLTHTYAYLCFTAPSASASPSTAVASPQSVKPSAAATPTSSSNKKEPLNFEVLNERTRNACLKLIHQSLGFESSADTYLIYDQALAIELAVFKQIGKGEVTGDYRAKVRSLTLNLKDKKNPTLRANVISGSVPADKLVLMTAEEMASEEQKAERTALQMQNLFNAKGAASQEAETDAFQCGKCKQRKCRYYQKQTRSADEPMTTFVSCVSCNHRWRFC